MQKRYLIHVAGFNPGLVMRLLLGAGTPRELAARGGFVLWLIDPPGGLVVIFILPPQAPPDPPADASRPSKARAPGTSAADPPRLRQRAVSPRPVCIRSAGVASEPSLGYYSDINDFPPWIRGLFDAKAICYPTVTPIGLFDAGSDIREGIARQRNAPAGFTPEVLALFEREPELIDVAAAHLLERHFALRAQPGRGDPAAERRRPAGVGGADFGVRPAWHGAGTAP